MAKKKTKDNMQLSFGDYQLKEVNVRLVLNESSALYSATPITTPEAAVDVLGDLLRGSDREMICVINLDSKMRAINFHVAAVGGINACMAPIANCFKTALLSNAAAVLLAHCHPSSDPTPSEQDFDVTKRFVQAGKLLDIPALDHVIIGAYQGEQYSFRANHPDMFYTEPDLSVFPEIDPSKGWSAAEKKGSYVAEKPSVIGRLADKQSQLVPAGSKEKAKKHEYSLG